MVSSDTRQDDNTLRSPSLRSLEEICRLWEGVDVFGKKRKLEEQEKLEAFEAALAAARQALASDDIAEIKALRRNLLSMWAQCGHPASYGTGTLSSELGDRIDVLSRRPYEQALRPCIQCGGRDFRISSPHNLEHLGDLRLVVCESCGLTLIFWADLGALTSRLFSPTFRVPDGAGPFR